MWSVCAVSMYSLFWHMQISLMLTEPTTPIVLWPYWWSPVTEVLHLHWVLLIINRPIPPFLAIKVVLKARWESITNNLVTCWFPACLDYCCLARRVPENREQFRPKWAEKISKDWQMGSPVQFNMSLNNFLHGMQVNPVMIQWFLHEGRRVLVSGWICT